MGQNSNIITNYHPYNIILETVFLVYHLVLKHLLQNVIRSSFCIPKVIRIGAYKGANYSPKITILVNIGTLLNKVFGPQQSIFNHLVLVCIILNEKVENLLGGG